MDEVDPICLFAASNPNSKKTYEINPEKKAISNDPTPIAIKLIAKQGIAGIDIAAAKSNLILFWRTAKTDASTKPPNSKAYGGNENGTKNIMTETVVTAVNKYFP